MKARLAGCFCFLAFELISLNVICPGANCYTLNEVQLFKILSLELNSSFFLDTSSWKGVSYLVYFELKAEGKCGIRQDIADYCKILFFI